MDKAQIKSTSLALDGAARALDAFMKTTEKTDSIDLASLDGTIRRLNNASAQLDSLIDGSALAHAGPADLVTLKQSHAAVFKSIGQSGKLFEAVINHGFLPKAKAMAEYHNSLGLSRALDGVPVETLSSIFEGLTTLNGSTESLLDRAKMFRPKRSSEDSLRESFAQVAAGASLATLDLSGPDRSDMINVALNLSQRLFTNAYGTDTALKTELGEAQRGGGFPETSERHEEAVVGWKVTRDAQVASLQVLKNLGPTEGLSPGLVAAVEAKLHELGA